MSTFIHSYIHTCKPTYKPTYTLYTYMSVVYLLSAALTTLLFIYLLHVCMHVCMYDQINLAGLLCTSLERPNLHLQNLALEKLAEDYVYSSFTSAVLAEKLVPQLCKEACKNPEASIKTQALYIISLVTWKLDESFVAGNILPSLKYIVDNERTAAVSMSVVGNYESIGNSLGLTYIASSVLPVLQVQSVLNSTILYCM